MTETQRALADGMSETDGPEIVVGETEEGEPYTLPVEDLLTGRLFITGKSGSGKSNTGSVIAEELLERGHPILIVDVDGEYWGLKEDYEVLHVGATDECDLQVGPEHAGKLAELALEQHVPIVLDVSGYLESDEVDELVQQVAWELFAREEDAREPFLMLVEEIHEFVPEQGSLGEVGKMLIRVAKRGRKRGLGIAGLSQRPANVKKDFITQADLLVWHRLTWETDTDLLRRMVGSDYADRVADLRDGQAFVQADWAEADVETVQFRRKHTFDAGATPGLDDVERPELKSIDEDLVAELSEISDRHQRRQDRIAQLEAQLEEREDRIADLEEQLEQARDLQRLGEAIMDAAKGSGDSGVEVEQQELLEEKNETISGLRERVDEYEHALQDVQEQRDDLEDEVDRLQGIEERVEQAERIEEQLDRARRVLGVEVEESVGADDRVAELREELQEARERIEELEAEKEQLQSEVGPGSANQGLAQLISHQAIQSAVNVAKRDSDYADRHFDRVLNVLASADGGPLTAGEITPMLDGVSKSTTNEVLKSLYETGILKRDKKKQSYHYELDRGFLERRVEVAEQEGAFDA